MADSILFSAASEESNYFAQKNYGVYRAATEFRKQGLSCQVVQYFNRFLEKPFGALMIKVM